MQTTIFKMNVQIEKLKLIEWLIGLEDLATLKQLEKLRNESEVATYEASLKPMSIKELEVRAMESSRAIAEGQVTDIEDILQEGGE